MGISRFLVDSSSGNTQERQLVGVPRLMYLTAVKGMVNKAKYMLKRDETEALAAENKPIVFAGYFYGRHLTNSRLAKPLDYIGSRLFKSADR